MSNPIKPTLKSEIISVFFVLLSIIASFYFYQNFPEQVPIHWNIRGEVDNYGSRALAAFLFPAIIISMYVLMLLLPYLDPKKARYEQFAKTYHIIKTFLVLFFSLIYYIASLNGLGYDLDVSIWTPALIGILFLIIGNYMSKLKPNWFIGIRTPWTLSSEIVWNKTHRLGGKVFMLGGLLMLLAIPASPAWKFYIMIAMTIIMALGTFVYSYYVYRQEENNKKQIK